MLIFFAACLALSSNKIIIANDDYLKSQIMIDGKKAVYNYSWYDCGGEWIE